MKRITVRVIGLLLCWAALGGIGCGRADRTTPRLRVAMSLAQEEWRVFHEKIFPLFEQETGWHVEPIQITAEDLTVKLSSLKQAAATGIDVFAQDNMRLTPLVTQGLVQPLDDLNEILQQQPLIQTVIPLGRFQGRRYFYPFRVNVQVLFYRKDKFKAWHLKPPRTWDEALAVSRFFYEQEGRGRALIKGFGGTPTATQVYELVLQAGGDPLAFDDEGCVAAFTFLQQLAPYLSPESRRAKWDTTNDILARGEAYWGFNWAFGVMVLVKRYGLTNIGTVSGWKGPAGEVHVLGGDVWGIPSTSAHPRMARQWIVFMSSARVQRILMRELGWPSIRTDAYDAVPEWMRPHQEALRAALERSRPRAQVAWWPAYVEAVDEAFERIVHHNEPVRPVLSDIKKRLEAAKTTDGS